MLTQETKRHIDAARQVLVGVVPNPSSQIDQITNALIYKFMDDMDQSAIKASGDPSFFVGDLERYAWTRLMDTRLGNQERMNLYSEALVKFSEAKQLPQLFRDIFKSAFLPYRSPEVLGLFLKEIDYFDYSHSEELGNAYEYLLSIMSSQGDAGQFRTPRHIIDFIVKAVDPTKDDKVLDPACGTAGFLVSAYKHILEQHDGMDKEGKKNNEKPLTPDERRALMNNFEGYDVDPGMVRISQVNMYLHHFKNPKIFNYNTLAQEERWGDKFNVILANPPFMSPKGGVSTHKRFSVQSNRSEVLFVDYIMNHLRPKGRAGIIVPEGIIFQSGTAHQQLRKNLIDDGLYAVVSLPSGVFQPYSGVKTSILLFNNELAKRSTEILFVKVEHDGFDLGATKRPVNKNDLPQTLEIINAWKNCKRRDSRLALYVEKIKIIESGDYNLSGDRYRVATDYTNARWPMVKLREIAEVINGRAYKQEELLNSGKYPVLRVGNFFSNKNWYYSDLELDEDKYCINGDLLYAWSASFGPRIWEGEKAIYHYHIWKIKTSDRLDKHFLYYFLEKETENIKSEGGRGVAMIHITKGNFELLEIPLPPLEVQKEIVAELDGYQSIISGARQIVENWKPKIEIDPKWEKVLLKEITDRVTKGTTPTTNGFEFQESGVNFIKIESIDDGGSFIKEKFAYINQECNESLKRSQLKVGDVLFSIAGALGRVALVDDSILPANTNQALAIVSPQKALNSKYLEQVLRSDLIQSQIYGLRVGVAQSNLSLAQVSNFEIPLPPLDIQMKIVEKIEAERVLVESSKKLIEIYEQKTKDVLSKLWAD